MSAPAVFRQVAREAERGDWPVDVRLGVGLVLHGVPYVPEDHDDMDAFALCEYRMNLSARSHKDRYYVDSEVMPTWVRWDAVLTIQHSEHTDSGAARA